MPEKMEIRPVKYLNNIVEPDHRFIKKVIQPCLVFQSIQTAAKTISGIEARHILWTGQLGRSFSVGLSPAQIVWPDGLIIVNEYQNTLDDIFAPQPRKL